MTESIPRPEYPRPQFVRDDWLCLNGEWQFEIDPGDSGLERGLAERELSDRIIVPFCPESTLSGIGNTDLMNAVWYRRTVTIPPEWAGRNVLLHFQAVDYDATVWVNGVEVGTPSRRLHADHLRPEGDRAGRSDGHHRRAGARSTRRAQAIGQAIAALRELRLHVHPHHRHLADGVDGAGAGHAAGPPAHHAGRQPTASFGCRRPWSARRPARTSARSCATGRASSPWRPAAWGPTSTRLSICWCPRIAAACGARPIRSCTTSTSRWWIRTASSWIGRPATPGCAGSASRGRSSS